MYYPVTDGAMDTDSYEQFAEGYFLTAKAMAWFWDAYLPDLERRSEPFASPLRASEEQLAGLPPSRRPSPSCARRSTAPKVSGPIQRRAPLPGLDATNEGLK
jgi:hypothetical protein